MAVVRAKPESQEPKGLVSSLPLTLPLAKGHDFLTPQFPHLKYQTGLSLDHQVL